MTQVALPLYSVEDYFGLVDVGKLDADAKVELLEGVIVEMPGQTPRHSAAVSLVRAELARIFTSEIRSQSPFIAGEHSSPEPDVMVLPGTAQDYFHQHPSEALIVVEVSFSSLPMDRLTKSRIYAGAGVHEYWIVNLVDDVLEVYRSPDRDGRIYGEHLTFGPGATVSPLAAPTGTIAVADLLPPRADLLMP